MRRPDEPSERLRRILDGVEDARATDPADGDPDLDPDLPDEGTRDGPVPQPPRPLTLPSSIATARWRVRPRAVVGVALLLAVAVTVLGVRLHLAQRDALPQAAPSTSGGPAVVATGDRSGFETGVGTGPATSGTAPAGTTPAAEVYVHVVGRVRSPGVVTVPAGARVEEAIEGAGGVREGADLAQVNLARPVVDGEQVVVPREGGATPVAGGVPAPAGPTAPAAAPGGPASTAAPSAPVDLNTADQATLETLPGVGPVLAARIVEWRTTNGGFTTVEELDEVSGIGEKLYAQISPKVTV